MIPLTTLAVTAPANTPKPAMPKMVIQNRFGGPTYQGPPATDLTAALIAAGGGAGSFSMVRAFSSMVGPAPLQTELASLRKQFGDDDTNQFVSIFDYVIDDGWKRLGENNVKVPQAGSLAGADLAKALVEAATTDSKYLFSGYFFDKLLTMKVNNQINSDIDTKFGVLPNTSFHKIAATFLYDLGQQLGDTAVRLPKQP